MNLQETTSSSSSAAGPAEAEVGEESHVQRDEALGLYPAGDKELLVIRIRWKQRRIGPAQP